MRIILKSVGAMVLVLAGFGLGWWIHDWPRAGDYAASSALDSAPSIEQIETLASLTTLRVHVADAIVTDIEGKTGEIRAVMVVHGNVTLGVNLSQARFESVDLKNRNAVLVLPEPKVQSVSLDTARTKVVALWESGLWIIVPDAGDADAVTMNLAFRQAEMIVRQAADDPDVVQRSRRQAQNVLAAFFGAIEWSVQVRWIDVSPVSAISEDRGPIRRFQRNVIVRCLLAIVFSGRNPLSSSVQCGDFKTM